MKLAVWSSGSGSASGDWRQAVDDPALRLIDDGKDAVANVLARERGNIRC